MSVRRSQQLRRPRKPCGLVPRGRRFCAAVARSVTSRVHVSCVWMDVLTSSSVLFAARVVIGSIRVAASYVIEKRRERRKWFEHHTSISSIFLPLRSVHASRIELRHGRYSFRIPGRIFLSVAQTTRSRTRRFFRRETARR